MKFVEFTWINFTSCYIFYDGKDERHYYILQLTYASVVCSDGKETSFRKKLCEGEKQ